MLKSTFNTERPVADAASVQERKQINAQSFGNTVLNKTVLNKTELMSLDVTPSKCVPPPLWMNLSGHDLNL